MSFTKQETDGCWKQVGFFTILFNEWANTQLSKALLLVAEDMT